MQNPTVPPENDHATHPESAYQPAPETHACNSVPSPGTPEAGSVEENQYRMQMAAMYAAAAAAAATAPGGCESSAQMAAAPVMPPQQPVAPQPEPCQSQPQNPMMYPGYGQPGMPAGMPFQAAGYPGAAQMVPPQMAGYPGMPYMAANPYMMPPMGMGAPVTGMPQQPCAPEADHCDSASQCSCGDSHTADPKHDAHTYGQIFGMVNDVASGNADPATLLAFLGKMDTQFWKGALVGAALALLLPSEGVKTAMGGMMAGVGNLFGKQNAPEAQPQEAPAEDLS